MLGDGPRDLSADFEVPAGLTVSLWAEAPLFFNPTAMDTDARGRVWVTEAVNYRKWRGRNPGLEHPAGDRVVILEDTDGDGAADRSSVFVQDPDLVAPLGICVLGEHSALVSCSPHAFVYTDTDRDGQADRRETFLSGFGGPDHDHGLHSFVIGPDGRYYVAVGNAGPHLVTDRDGFNLRSGSLYNDGGEFVADNTPDLISDDGRLWTGGLILRLDQDGGGLSVRGHNFRNNYEAAIDAFGDLYVSDNDDDGNQACRALWVLPRSNNGYFSKDGARYWTADRRPGQDTQRAHWHQDDPGVAPMGTILGAGGPTGVALIENANLGSQFEGWMLAADAGARVVYGLSPEPDGAGIALANMDFLRPRPAGESTETRTWFRPSDVLIGTDGALYVSDWYDPGVGGHAMGDRKGYGRILRIARSNTTPKPVLVDLSNTAACVAALASPAVNVRGRAARALLEDEQAPQALERALVSGAPYDERTLARMQWLLAMQGAPLPAAVRASLSLPRAIVEWRARGLREIRSEPSLRREVALNLEGDSSPQADDLWLELSQSVDAKDRTYLEALSLAARGREARLWARIVDPAIDPLQWDVRVTSLAWALHPAEAVPGLKARAAAASLAVPERARAIDALAFVEDRAAGEALLELAMSTLPDVREHSRWWLRFRDGNDWSAWNLAGQLGSAPEADGQVQFESPLMHAGIASVDVDLRGATHLILEVQDGGNGNSCDWADWVGGTLDGPAGRVELVDLEWIEAAAAWGSVRRNQNCEGGPLSVAGQSLARGIGTHADSRIVYALPAGAYERFQAQVGPDDKGVRQGGGTSLRFRVSTRVPVDPAHFEARVALLADAEQPAAERAAAAKELCTTREGGLMLLAAASAGRFDAEARGWIRDSIFTNPDLAVRALASEQFPRASAASVSIAELAALIGDERRGEKLFFSQQAGCSRCHVIHGRGGEIGPDLSAARTKYAKDALLDAILNPSAGIAFGYDTWMFETEEGRVVSGFLLADGEQVLLKDTAGVRTSLPRESIVSRRKAKVSTMPDNISAGLSPQELADLVQFLTVDRAAVRVASEAQALFNGVDLSGWTHYLTDASKSASDVWSVQDGVLDCKGQPIGYLRTQETFEDFVLELEWRFPPGSEPGNSGVLLRQVGPDKVWPKSVEAQLQHRWAGDIWNIDEVSMLVDESRTDGRRTQRLAPSNEKPLGEWNRYKITMDRGNLGLEVNGTLQNSATWVERVAGHICLQSEGARIQFRNIVLRRIE